MATDPGLEVHTKELNGEADSFASMLKIKEVADELGVSQSQVRRLCARGSIFRYGPGPDGSFRFRPEDVEALARSLTLEEQETTERKEAESFSGAAVALVRQAQDHAKELTRLTHAPIQATLEVLRTENDRLRSRIDTLEAERLRYIEKYEQMVSLQHMRDLDAKESERKMARQDKAFELLMSRAPKLLEQVEASLGALAGSPEDKAKVKAAIDLLQSLQPVQLEVLASSGSGFLTEEQSEKVRQIVGKTETTSSSSSDATSPAPQEANANG